MSSDVYTIGADGVDDSSKSSRTARQWFAQAETNQWTVQQWLDQANRALTTADHDLPFPSITKCEVAIEAYDAALQIAPGNSKALDGKAYALFVLGNQLSDSERYEEAIAAYDQVLQLPPGGDKRTGLLPSKWSVMERLEQYEAIIVSCDQALATKHDNDKALAYKSVALYYSGQYEAAIATCDQILDTHPRDHITLANKGAALEQLRRYEEAIIVYDQTLQCVSGVSDESLTFSRQTLSRKWFAMRGLGEYEALVSSCDHALATIPVINKPYSYRAAADRALADKEFARDALEHRAIALYYLGQYEAAIATFDQILDTHPYNSIALIMKGIALGQLKRYEDAIIFYDQALQLLLDDNKKTLTLSYKWFAMQGLEQYEALIGSCDQASATNPDNNEALSYKAIALYQLGQYEAAIVTYDQILEIHPCDFDALAKKGMVLERLGRYEDAIASYDRFLAVEPSGDQDTEETEMIRTRKEMILKASELNFDEANNLNT